MTEPDYGPFEYSPITTRPKLSWPGDARVALWVIPNIEFFSLAEKVPAGSGGTGGKIPDIPTWSARDYGNRVGVFRLMDALDEHDIRATVALNSDLCDHHPFIIEEGMKRGWEWMGHNESNTRRLAEYLNRSAPFWAYAYACFIVIGFIVLFMAEPPLAPYEQAGRGKTGLASLLRHPATMAVCILNFAVFSARSSAQWVGLPLLVGAIYDLSVIGLALGLIAVTNLVALPFADKVIRRVGSGPANIYAGLATAAGLFMLALGADFVWFWSSLFVLGTSAAIGATALTIHLVEAVQSSGLGPALGLYRTSGDLGYVAGPVIIGILSDSLGLVVSQEIMLSMAVMLIATLAFALLTPNTKRA